MSIDLAGVRELYPFESHFLDVSGQRMHYLDEGAGPAVIMLHGNPTWSFYYRELVTALSDRWRVIVPDHIGCGLSDKPQDYDYTLLTHIDNLESLIDHLELDGATLAVHDWGGPIGFGLARRRPELIRSFIVFNTSAFVGPCPLRIRLCGLPLIGDALVRGMNAFARGAIRMSCQKHERMTARVRRGYLLPYSSFANRVAILRFVRDIPLTPAVPSYQVISEIEASLAAFKDRPMILLWGARDFCFNRWYLEQWRARFPQARVHQFEDAGHYVVQDAHDRIVPLIEEFLQSC